MKIDSPVSTFSTFRSTTTQAEAPLARQPSASSFSTSTFTDGFERSSMSSPLSAGMDSFSAPLSNGFDPFGSSESAGFDPFGSNESAGFNSFGSNESAGFNSFGSNESAGFNSFNSDESRMVSRLFKRAAISALRESMFEGFSGASGSLSPTLNFNSHPLHGISGGGSKPMMPPPGTFL